MSGTTSNRVAMLAWAALIDLTQSCGDDHEAWTTQQIAEHAGEDIGRVGGWTKPWREALFALMAEGLVQEPTGRPHRWRMSDYGRAITGLSRRSGV